MVVPQAPLHFFMVLVDVHSREAVWNQLLPLCHAVFTVPYFGVVGSHRVYRRRG